MFVQHVQKGIKLRADPCHIKRQQQLTNLPHSLMFWQAPLSEGFNCLWQALLLRQLCLRFLLSFPVLRKVSLLSLLASCNRLSHRGNHPHAAPLSILQQWWLLSTVFLDLSQELACVVQPRQFGKGVMNLHDFSSRPAQHWCC